MPPTGPVGVMGGTFDPIHLGHLVAASEVAHRFALSEVLFVPTGRPWQKTHRTVTDADHRYAMTIIATAADDRFTVSRVDIDRPGPTYTVDTLRDLAAGPTAGREMFFITGADALQQILTWRDPVEVLRMAHMVGVTRPGHRLAAPDVDPASVSLIEIPALAISSSDIRSRVAAGRPIRYLVPDGVDHYIAKTDLYRDDV
ncbi:MAG: nicotinate-nucleotide adenylyltransferase [Candidatus Nanopelagicales bacterium]|jgi:nicotinate-nucleotide adenylyltransferase